MTEKIRKQDDTYITSLPNEVIQALSLNDSDKLDFIIRDGQVSLEKSLAVKSDSGSNDFYDDIDFFMNKHDQTFKNLVEK